MTKKSDGLEVAPSTVIEDRYVVRRSLGHGGAGVVYEVEQLGLGITRALKFLDPRKSGLEEEFLKTLVMVPESEVIVIFLSVVMQG